MNNNIINFKESVKRLKEKNNKNTYFVDFIDADVRVVIVEASSKQEAEELAWNKYIEDCVEYDEPDREYVEIIVQKA